MFMWNLTFSIFIMFSINSMIYTWIKIRFFLVLTAFAIIDAAFAILFIFINLWIMRIIYTVCKGRCAQLAKSIISENSNKTADRRTQSFKNKVSQKNQKNFILIYLHNNFFTNKSQLLSRN